MSTTPRSGSPAGSQASKAGRPEQSMVVEHSMHEDADSHQDTNTPSLSAAMKAKQPQHQQQVATDGGQTGHSLRAGSSPSPSTAGPALADFDWTDFEQRYLDALGDADGKEQQIMEEFNQLVDFFAAWAAASSAHDDERAIKRLRTRTRHVQLSEQTLTQKKEHMAEVVKAFKSALTLLNAA
ncbi:hypothetical protein Micbo1qcDRAFT_162806 [Microdochium bolleyi]|uniref:Uncharacterized protein n=1 Tax=Microdochium bolleyi TaxID=196109 RepID=A0A136J276_9PEZI|nr:hypothetical protein Micbo1qcDRAFT_162806 [Microdochium bolleyi]